MQYVGNAVLDDSGARVNGVALTAAPDELDTFLTYAYQEIDQPWVKVVGNALEAHAESTAEWIGVFVPLDGDLPVPEDASGHPVTVEVWDERHAARVIERVVLPNGRGYYVLEADAAA